MQNAFRFLGLRDSASQRDLLQQLQAAGAFDLREATRYLNLIPKKSQATENTPAPYGYVMLDPAQIQTDSATYQFRSGGDKNGVTKTGQMIAERWDPILHGDPVLVHERLDGRVFIADGHHRLDLAKRLNSENKGPGRIAAQVLREADGYTPLDVKIIAAYKNFAHGHFKPIDAARVFKEAKSPNVHQELLPNLQMNKDNIRFAFSMSKLSDSALDKVESENIPAPIAAALAERVSAPAKQESVLAVISQKLAQDYTPPPYGYDIGKPNDNFVGRLAAQSKQQLGHAI